jgi:hypothetical protein
LRKAPPNTAHQTAYGKIEPRRTVLPLVVAIRREFQHFEGFVLVAEDMGHNPVNLGIPAAAFLVVESSLISDARQHQSMTDAVNVRTIPGKPGDGPDGARNEKEAVGIP